MKRMKKRMILLLAVALLLAGCSDTVVYIPEDDGPAEDGIVVYIPVNPDKPAEPETNPTAAQQTEPEETEPEQKNTATVSKKTTSSSNKGTTSSNKNNTTNKETITGSAKPAETQPAPTEDASGSGQITETVPDETEPPRYDISDYAVSDLEYAILDRINEYRLEEGLEELWLDEYLCAVVSCRSYEASRVWSHTRPDGRGYWTVLEDYGYGGSVSGELLGYTTGDADAVVDKWMSSESHRAMLMGGSSLTGIGIYCSGGVIYVACLLIG